MNFRQLEKVVPVDALAVTQRQLSVHVQRLPRNIALVLCRADFDAKSATGAVFNGYLNGVELIGKLAPLGGHGLESGGRLGEVTWLANFGANRGMRTNQDAFTTLDTKIRFPYWNFLSDVALLPLRRA